MLNYYKYRFSKSISALVVALIIGFMVVNIGFIQRVGYYSWYDTQKYYGVSFSPILIYMFIQTFVFADLEFAPYRNKRNLDTWFSFPLSREKLAIVSCLNVITIFAIEIFAYTINGFVLMGAHTGLNYAYYLPAMFFIFVFTVLVFLFVSTVFLFGNTVKDGAISVYAWINVPGAIMTAIYAVCGYLDNEIHFFEDDRLSLGVLTAPIRITEHLEYLVNESVIKKFMRTAEYGYNPYDLARKIKGNTWTSLGIWLVIFIIAAVALPYIFSKRPTEKIGGISDFILSYDFIIPFYSLVFIIITQDPDLFVLRLFVIPSAYIAYVIYRRTPKLTASRWIILGVILVLAVVPFLRIFGIEPDYFLF